MEEEGRVGGKFIPRRCYTGTVYRDGEREEIVLTDGNDDGLLSGKFRVLSLGGKKKRRSVRSVR